MTRITVTVPATTANLGPGFDCLGAALNLHNHLTFSRLTDAEPDLMITVTGSESDRVTTDKSNLLYQAFCHLYQTLGQNPPPVKMEIQLGVPLARGLGSSATAIVGGLVGANLLAGQPFSQTEVLAMAIALEGHPDNVAPALLGGCQLAVNTGESSQLVAIAWQSNLVPVLAIPDFELSTEKARAVLPADYPRKDAIFNASHLALLIKALESGNGDWLRLALEDQIHQPYRQALIPGYPAMKTSALEAGAYGLVISGAGPTLLAIAAPETASQVAETLKTTWQAQGIQSDVKVLALDNQGTRSHSLPAEN